MADESTALSERDLRFNFRSGTPALFLVETFGEWTRRRYDRIMNAQVWNDWLQQINYPPVTEPVSANDLEQMRDLRRAIYGLAQARVKGVAPLPTDVRAINQYAEHPVPVAQLAADGHTRQMPVRITQPQVLSMLARDAIELFSGEHAERVRECASHICPVIFVDRSRRGDRHWCSTNCGARHATARYRQRQQEEEGNCP
ncbi:ABATE domain-containing protein [Pseudomonas entomophila]|uniref:CGNR zinc finger domain-containing protein n=1 Tax=Pseudomonas entomophila TaxID=312306 RepID=UPI0023D80A2A|nr:ABATE domain-containing protein [Pseudomonas entomophila]MDF0730109.1 ABATE domain-containing protein [Pseudomonas entomophila]